MFVFSSPINCKSDNLFKNILIASTEGFRQVTWTSVKPGAGGQCPKTMTS